MFQDDKNIRPLPKDLLNINDTIVYIQDVQNNNFDSHRGDLHLRPFYTSRIYIFSSSFVPLPLVRPILGGDVQLVDNEFVTHYMEGERVLYVSLLIKLEIL